MELSTLNRGTGPRTDRLPVHSHDGPGSGSVSAVSRCWSRTGVRPARQLGRSSQELSLSVVLCPSSFVLCSLRGCHRPAYDHVVAWRRVLCPSPHHRASRAGGHRRKHAGSGWAYRRSNSLPAARPLGRGTGSRLVYAWPWRCSHHLKKPDRGFRVSASRPAGDRGYSGNLPCCVSPASGCGRGPRQRSSANFAGRRMWAEQVSVSRRKFMAPPSREFPAVVPASGPGRFPP